MSLKLPTSPQSQLKGVDICYYYLILCIYCFYTDNNNNTYFNTIEKKLIT